MIAGYLLVLIAEWALIGVALITFIVILAVFGLGAWLLISLWRKTL